MRILLLFLVVIGVLLVGGTYFTRKTQSSLGSYKTTTYGWPEPWVYIHAHEVSKTTEWRVDWRAMVFPGVLVFSITTVGSLILLWPAVRSKEE